MAENHTITFRVKDMTCNHCVKAITNAVEKAIPATSVTVDLTQHTVTVTGASDQAHLARIIEEEGYTPEAV